MAVALQWGRPISVMKYVVTGMDLRLVGDIGNCKYYCEKSAEFGWKSNRRVTLLENKLYSN